MWNTLKVGDLIEFNKNSTEWGTPIKAGERGMVRARSRGAIKVRLVGPHPALNCDENCIWFLDFDPDLPVLLSKITIVSKDTYAVPLHARWCKLSA